MILSAVAIAVVVLIAYMWGSRGFFSAFLHMVCVFVAGAVALAVWEPLALFIMGMDDRGGWMMDISWGVGLALPFALTLALIRVACDKLVPGNIDMDSVTNFVGGGACGAVSGVIASGIMVMSLGYMRLGTELFGYQPIVAQGFGSLERKGSLILPVDRITVGMYSWLSESTFRPLGGETLAKWRPDAADEPALLRINYPAPEGGAKHTLKPGTFEVLARYTYQPTNPKDLLNDTFDPRGQAQQATGLDGQQVNTAQTTLEGFVIKFKPGAKEKNGAIILGNSQVRLIVRSTDNRSIGVHPVAIIAPAKGDTPLLSRFRFDAPNTFIPSVGGASEWTVGFEFPVPRGYTPLALMVKGIRHNVQALGSFRTFTTMADRDNAIRANAILPSVNIAALDESQAVTVRLDRDPSQLQSIRIAPGLWAGATLQKDDLRGLEIDESNKIINGTAKFKTADTRNQGIDMKLAVRTLSTTDDTVIVQVVVDGRNTQFGFLEIGGLDDSAAPVLLDTNGQPYQAAGYLFKDSEESWIQYTPERPISAKSELPVLSRSTPNNEVTLLFRVSKNVKIDRFAVGNKVIAKFTPPLETSPKQ